MSDDKVNMSLDDIIRLQKKNTKPGTTPSSTRKVVRRTGASALQVNVRGRGGIAKKRTGGPGGAGTSSASNTPQRRTVVRRGVPAGRGRKVVGAGIRRRPATAAVNANVADRQATKRLVQNLVKKALKRQTGRPVLASPVVRAVTAPSPFVLGGVRLFLRELLST